MPNESAKVYVSHPRNGGSKLAAQIADKLKSALNVDVYLPLGEDAYGILSPRDIQMLNDADMVIVVLNRSAATKVVPRHIIQFELRELAARENKPEMIVVRAEPCALPEGAQDAAVTISAFEDAPVDKVVSVIVETLIGRLHGTASGQLTPSLRTYLENVRDAHSVWSARYSELHGRIRDQRHTRRSLVEDAAAAAELDAILSSVSLPLAAELDPSWSASAIQARRVDDIREILYTNRKLALVGEAGSGKTTTLRSLAADLALQALASNSSPPVPVFIRLSEMSDDNLEAAISRYLAPTSLESVGERGVWIMLDGLNEVPEAKALRILVQLRGNPDMRAIVTCRRAEFEKLHADLPVAEILPLSVADIPGFLMRWGLPKEDADALFWTLAGQDTSRIWRKWERAGETFERFWSLESAKQSAAFQTTDNFDDDAYDSMRRRMREQNRLPGLLDVVRNPFLLTLTVAIYNRMHELPTRKGELFRAFVYGLLQRQGNELAANIDDIYNVLKFVARIMNERNTTSLEDTALEVFSELPASGLQHVLDGAREASVIDASGGRVHFGHQLLQDYFAAYYLSDVIAEGQPATLLWPDEGRKWWTPTIWDEAAVILTGLAGNDPRLNVTITSPWDVVTWLTAINPILAWRCVEENNLDAAHPRAAILRRPTPGVRAAPRARLLMRVGTEDDNRRSGVGVAEDGIPDIEWMEVDAGEFTYGSDEVRFLDRFWMGRFPVTNVQFQAFLDSSLFNDSSIWNGMLEMQSAIVEAAFDGSYNPRDRVSWFEACAFGRWLESVLKSRGDARIVSGGNQVRLPSDEEWEKAARGTDGRLYPWGNDFDPTRCNTLETGLGRTCPVGIFPDGASPYGVEDLAGNVWEWCWNPYFVDDGTHAGRVNRGGSCFRDRRRALATYRHDCLPGYHSSGRGFRVVVGPRI